MKVSQSTLKSSRISLWFVVDYFFFTLSSCFYDYFNNHKHPTPSKFKCKMKWKFSTLVWVLYFFLFFKQKTSLRRQTLNLKILFYLYLFYTKYRFCSLLSFLHLFLLFCLWCMLLVGFKEFILWHTIRNTQYIYNKNMSNDLFIQIFLGFPKKKNVIY